jgi:type IV pilus assembly protein PilM
LARPDIISSTERLLELIRGKTSCSPEASTAYKPSTTTEQLTSSFRKVLPFRKKITVGVNIGYHDLKIVEISHTSDKKLELVNFKKVPFESDISIDGPIFPRFLRTILTDLIGPSKNIEIWSAISSTRVETRYLRIPRVPKKQIANAVFWSYKKEVNFNENEEIFDFEVLGGINVDGIRKTEVLAYSAPKEEILRLENIFSKSGYPLTGVTIISFVLQNLLRSNWIDTEGKNLCNLYIGRDWSRIDIFSNGNLILSRGIKAGIKSMVEAVREAIYEGPEEVSGDLMDTENMAEFESVDEVSQYEAEQARKIFYGFINNSLSFMAEVEETKLEEGDIFKMIFPALERLVRQVDRTLEHYSLNFEKERIDKIYLSGPVGNQQRIVEHIGDQLGLSIDVLDPFGSDLQISEDISIPESASERESFAPAVGMALSNTSLTPNFIFTYKDKETSSKIRRINNAVFTALIFLMAISVGVYIWQSYRISQKKVQIDQLQRKVGNIGPYLDQKLIEQLVEQIAQKRQQVVEVGQRYIGMAAITEISALTPSNISLSSLIAELGEVLEDKKDHQKRLLVIDGIISGKRITFESALAEYLIKLKASPLFDKPSIKKKSIEIVGDKEVLRFTAELEFV